MDLSLLRHLSDAALQREADKRGLSVDGLDRAALIAAIDAHARSTPSPAQRDDALPEREDDSEPIRTRTMAELLFSQGHLERAERIYRELCAAAPADADLRARHAHLADRAADRRLERLAQEFLRSASAGIAVLGQGVRRIVCWRVEDAGRARAEALIGEGALALRIVRVSAQPHRGVETRTEDRTVSAPQGSLRLDVSAATRVVVAIGMKGPRGFASIANARVP